MAGATGLAYDAAGNLTAANGLTLGWDCWGRLTSVAGTPQGTVTFAYDFAGRRVAKTVAGVTTYFLYDGDMLLAELDSAGSVLKSYTWGATGLISERAAGQSRFHLYDSSGNTRLLVTASGTVISRSAYNAWGAPLAGLAPATPLGYSGRFGGYTDSETGLILLGARYYAPALGRFVSRDPSGLNAGVNAYGYCDGDAVNYADPSGADRGHVSGVLKGFGGGLFWSSLYEVRPWYDRKTQVLEARFGFPDQQARFGWFRTFHLDAPHKNVPYFHFNSDIPGLQKFKIDHLKLPESAYRACDLRNIRAAARGLFLAGLFMDGVDILTAPSSRERDRAAARAGLGLFFSYLGGAAGSALCPGPGTAVLAGSGGVFGSWMGDQTPPECTHIDAYHHSFSWRYGGGNIW